MTANDTSHARDAETSQRQGPGKSQGKRRLGKGGKPTHRRPAAPARPKPPTLREGALTREPDIFKPTARRNVFRESQMLANLRACAESLNSASLTIKQFRAWPGRICSQAPIAERFGSWSRALVKAGLSPTRYGRTDPADLIANLEEIWRDLGRPPGALTLARYGRYSVGPYNRRWGSLPHARAALAAFHKGELSREALLRGRAPSHTSPGSPSRRRPRAHLPVTLRWRIMQRDHFRCAICGRSPSAHPGLALHIDHIKPLHEGGDDHEPNLRTLCADCNHGRNQRRGRASALRPPHRPHASGCGDNPAAAPSTHR
ncbi:MAG: HNH endonuclease [Phycisphaerales bacterium]